jgi:hypothetical protein
MQFQILLVTSWVLVLVNGFIIDSSSHILEANPWSDETLDWTFFHSDPNVEETNALDLSYLQNEPVVLPSNEPVGLFDSEPFDFFEGESSLIALDPDAMFDSSLMVDTDANSMHENDLSFLLPEDLDVHHVLDWEQISTMESGSLVAEGNACDVDDAGDLDGSSLLDKVQRRNWCPSPVGHSAKPRKKKAPDFKPPVNSFDAFRKTINIFEQDFRTCSVKQFGMSHTPVCGNFMVPAGWGGDTRPGVMVNLIDVLPRRFLKIFTNLNARQALIKSAKQYGIRYHA